jgi:hypothetical protein
MIGGPGWLGREVRRKKSGVLREVTLHFSSLICNALLSFPFSPLTLSTLFQVHLIYDIDTHFAVERDRWDREMARVESKL